MGTPLGSIMVPSRERLTPHRRPEPSRRPILQLAGCGCRRITAWYQGCQDPVPHRRVRPGKLTRAGAGTVKRPGLAADDGVGASARVMRHDEPRPPLDSISSCRITRCARPTQAVAQDPNVAGFEIRFARYRQEGRGFAARLADTGRALPYVRLDGGAPAARDGSTLGHRRRAPSILESRLAELGESTVTKLGRGAFRRQSYIGDNRAGLPLTQREFEYERPATRPSAIRTGRFMVPDVRGITDVADPTAAELLEKVQ